MKYDKKRRRLETALVDLDAAAIERALAAITPGELQQMIAEDPTSPIALVAGLGDALEAGGEEEGKRYMKTEMGMEPPAKH